MENVLYLSYDGMTDPLGQSQVLPYLAGLSKQGYRITLISFEKKERVEKERELVESICRENNIEWHALPYTRKPPVLSTVRDLSRMKKLVRHLQAAKTFSIVHCRSYVAAHAGLWMQRKWGTKFIFDMRGFWADERVEGGLWKLSNPLYRIIYHYFKRMEARFLSRADHTIVLTHQAKEIIHSWKQVAGQPIPLTVIPCCVDLDVFNPSRVQPETIDQLRTALEIPETAEVITYIGSIGTWYMLPEMLAFFKRLLLQKPGTVLVFVTNEAAGPILAAAEKAGIPAAAIRVRSAKRMEVPAFISLGKYSLFFIKPVFSKKASSPTKQGEIMAMGKPVICNSMVGDTDHVVDKYHSGVLVHAFSDREYDRVIGNLHEHHFNPAAIRQGAAAFFSLAEGVKAYAGAYRAVLHEK